MTDQQPVDEPVDAAWSGMGDERVVESDYCGCESEGCTNLTRMQPEHVYYDGSVRESENITEHIAGPNCTSGKGYSGYRKCDMHT